MVEGKIGGLAKERKGCRSNYAKVLAVQLAVKQTTSQFQTWETEQLKTF